jgi:hypothetical protein
LQTVGFGYVGTNGDRPVAGEMRGFFARLDIDVGNHHLSPFASKQDGSGAADPGAGAGNESDLVGEPRHRTFLSGLGLAR